MLPLTTPEIVLGSSLATLFLDWDITRGFTTVVIAHVMFQVSFVALTVRARVRGFDWTLEQAAQDLGASPMRTFWKVTFPLILPGILAAALLSFALSLDDFIITLFNAGSLVTFPLYINGSFRVKFPPEVNVLATVILLVSVALMLERNAVGRPRAPQVRDVTQPIRHVFVYGTLRPGDVRWHFLAPFVVDDGWRDTVRGPVVRHRPRLSGGSVQRPRARSTATRSSCSSESCGRALEVLDEVEGIVDGEYSRVVVRTGRGVDAWAYASGDGLDLTPIASGDWFLHRPP